MENADSGGVENGSHPVSCFCFDAPGIMLVQGVLSVEMCEDLVELMGWVFSWFIGTIWGREGRGPF